MSPGYRFSPSHPSTPALHSSERLLAGHSTVGGGAGAAELSGVGGVEQCVRGQWAIAHGAGRMAQERAQPGPRGGARVLFPTQRKDGVARRPRVRARPNRADLISASSPPCTIGSQIQVLMYRENLPGKQFDQRLHRLN